MIIGSYNKVIQSPDSLLRSNMHKKSLVEDRCADKKRIEVSSTEPGRQITISKEKVFRTPCSNKTQGFATSSQNSKSSMKSMNKTIQIKNYDITIIDMMAKLGYNTKDVYTGLVMGNEHLVNVYQNLSLSSTSEIKLPKSHSLILRPDPKDLDFNFIESENPTAAFEENSFLDQSKFAKPDEIDEEEAKYETDYDFEVVESDFQKALELRRQRKDEVKVYKELYCISNSNDPKHPNFIYTDDQNEDEIFSKDVHMLDIVNTTFIEGKLKLTRFKLVFIPYERVKLSPAEDGSTKRKNDYEYVAKKLEPHKVRYFMIPLQMISSIKDQCDK